MKKKKNKKIEFSKLVVMGIMVMFFMVAIAGIYISLFIDCTVYTILCSFVGAAVTPTLALYLKKAEAENKLKIQNNNENSK